MTDKRRFHPDDTDLAFVTRWNILVAALLVEPSIKLVARTVVDYGLTDGEGIYPGNERLARQTGLSGRQVQEAWHFLRATGMAERENRSVWTGRQRMADLYRLEIPPHWHQSAVLGPNCKRFTCQQCGKVLNAPPCNGWVMEKRPGCRYLVPKVVDKADGVRAPAWYLWKATFCPARRGQMSCQALWERANQSWGRLSNDAAWEMFRKARDDDWPALS